MSKISSFVRAVVGIIILAFLLYKLDFNEVIKAISGFGIIILFLFILKYLFEALIKAMNVKILFDSIGEKISYFKLFRYFIVSYSLGLFSPGRIGDLALIPMLKKEKIDYGKSILVEVVDKFITSYIFYLYSRNICNRLCYIFKENKGICQKVYIEKIFWKVQGFL